MEDNFKDKKDLEERIQENNRNLNELKRRNQMSTIASSGNDKDKDKEEEVNIEELLKDITKDINRMYKNTLEAHADLEAK